MRGLPEELTQETSNAALPATGQVLRSADALKAFWAQAGRPDLSSSSRLMEGTIGIALAVPDTGTGGWQISVWGFDRGDKFEVGWTFTDEEAGLAAFFGNPTAVAVFKDPGKPVSVRRLEPGPQVAAFLSGKPKSAPRNGP